MLGRIKSGIREKEDENTPCPSRSSHSPRPTNPNSNLEHLPLAPHQALPPRDEELSDMLGHALESHKRFLGVAVSNRNMTVTLSDIYLQMYVQLRDELANMSRLRRFLSFSKRKRLRSLKRMCMNRFLNAVVEAHDD